MTRAITDRYPFTAYGRIQGQPSNVSAESYWFAWDSEKTQGCSLTPFELKLADATQSFWGSFARAGQPAASVGWVWEPFSLANRSVLQLDVDPLGGLRLGLKQNDCAFWAREAPLGPH